MISFTPWRTEGWAAGKANRERTKDKLFSCELSFPATKEFSILAYQPNAQAAWVVSFEQQADLPLPREAGIIPLLQHWSVLMQRKRVW